MDSDRFDRLARVFGHARSRRQAFRGLAGVAAGTIALSVGGTSAAPCKPLGRGCKNDGQCCDNNCATNSGKGPAKTCQPNTPPPSCTDTGQLCPDPCFCCSACSESDGQGNFTCVDTSVCFSV